MDRPNIRAAQTGQINLRSSAKDKRKKVHANGQTDKLKKLERMIDEGGVAINMNVNILREMLVDKSTYQNYYKQTAAEIRNSWPANLAQARGQADNWLFPLYYSEIIFGALIPCTDGKPITHCDGLPRYGHCTVHIDAEVIEKLASLFVRDSLYYYQDFGEDHNPSKEDCPAEDACIWEDRCDLAIHKCADQLAPSLADSNIIKLLLQVSPTKTGEDTFIEAHIYTGVKKAMIAGIRLSVNLTKPEHKEIWTEIEDLAKDAGLPFSTIS
ncbi:MAG: hypothetical protein GY742_11735 [Hyphomicrobiales bacterium]|nr:hypothetical protein [Hyphomicrobiales bacterium]